MTVTWIAATPTVGAAALSAREQVGGVMSFASAVTTTGTSGVVVAAQAIITTAVTAQLDLILFSADPDSSDAGDNNAISFGDPEMLTGRGLIKLPMSEVTALNAYAFWSGYQVFECAATTLFVVCITNNGWTPAANGLTIRLGILPTL